MNPTTLKLRRTRKILLLSTLIFASGNMLARLGVTVKNESSKNIAVRIEKGIKGWVFIGKAGSARTADFLPSESGERAIHFYVMDEKGEPEKDGVYYTNRYKNPDLVVIKDDGNTLKCELTEAVLGTKKGKPLTLTLDDKMLHIENLSTANSVCDRLSNPKFSDFTGVKVLNSLDQPIEANITNSIIPTPSVKITSKDYMDIPSKPGDRFIQWQIEGDPNQYSTAESYSMPHTIRIKKDKSGFMVYDMISGVIKIPKTGIRPKKVIGQPHLEGIGLAEFKLTKTELENIEKKIKALTTLDQLNNELQRINDLITRTKKTLIEERNKDVTDTTSLRVNELKKHETLKEAIIDKLAELETKKGIEQIKTIMTNLINEIVQIKKEKKEENKIIEKIEKLIKDYTLTKTKINKDIKKLESSHAKKEKFNHLTKYKNVIENFINYFEDEITNLKKDLFIKKIETINEKVKMIGTLRDNDSIFNLHEEIKTLVTKIDEDYKNATEDQKAKLKTPWKSVNLYNINNLVTKRLKEIRQN